MVISILALVRCVLIALMRRVLLLITLVLVFLMVPMVVSLSYVVRFTLVHDDEQKPRKWKRGHAAHPQSARMRSRARRRTRRVSQRSTWPRSGGQPRHASSSAASTARSASASSPRIASAVTARRSA